MRPDSIITIDAGDLQSLSVVGDTYTIINTGNQTNGAYAAIDMLIPPQGGPGPHAHANIQETFYVLEGEVVFKSETQSYTAKKGSVINIPTGGAVHCFKNETNSTARLLCIVTPPGIDDFFKEIGKPVKPGTFLPPTEMNSAEIDRMKNIAVKYGQELFPPAYLDK